MVPMASCSIGLCESTALPNWLELPKDITANILQRLGTIDIVTSACLVCPIWWKICKDPLMWHTIHITNVTHFPYYDQLMEICHYAIKQSCGHLQDFSIEKFATDYLLKCIAESASNLRCLRIPNCQRISNKGFNEAVQKLPLLEVLDISLCNLTTDSLEVVCKYCPLLTDLKFERMGFIDNPHNIDHEAFAIANSMFGLRHLSIIGNMLSNVGLLAILDACPLLESLDIRVCKNLCLDENLLKQRLDQIKNVQLPEFISISVRRVLPVPSVFNYEDYSDDDRVTYWEFIIDDDCYDPYD